MSNLVRHNLTIEGNDVQQVLEAIGFNPEGEPIKWGTAVQPENAAVLIDFGRIIPRPKAMPREGWEKWVGEYWGTLPYDGARDGDIFELTNSKASFKFYTRSTPAFPVIETLAKRFPQFKVSLRTWELTNHRMGEAEWQNGMRTLFVPMFALKLRAGGDTPANDPVTDKMRTAAAQLVTAAVETCLPCTPHAEVTESIVAELIAASGHYVNVEFEPNDDGSWCLYIDVEGKVTPENERVS